MAGVEPPFVVIFYPFVFYVLLHNTLHVGKKGFKVDSEKMRWVRKMAMVGY